VSASPALPAADRLVQIVFDLRAAFGVRAEAAGPFGLVLALVVRWLDRLYLRFVRVAERARAGTLRPPLPRERKPAASTTRRTPPPAPSPGDERLPQKLSWLLGLIGAGAVASAEDLRAVLADPETAALLARAPQLARLLRPLCRALGVAFPKAHRPPPRPRRPRPAPPEPTADPMPDPAPDPGPRPATYPAAHPPAADAPYRIVPPPKPPPPDSVLWSHAPTDHEPPMSERVRAALRRRAARIPWEI